MNTALSNCLVTDHGIRHCHKTALVACLGVFLMATGCGSSDARMQTDAREVAELHQEFLKAANLQMAELTLSLINKTPNKNSHKDQVDAVAEKIEGIKKRYSSGENKTKFEALIKKAEADLP